MERYISKKLRYNRLTVIVFMFMLAGQLSPTKAHVLAKRCAATAAAMGVMSKVMTTMEGPTHSMIMKMSKTEEFKKIMSSPPTTAAPTTPAPTTPAPTTAAAPPADGSCDAEVDIDIDIDVDASASGSAGAPPATTAAPTTPAATTPAATTPAPTTPAPTTAAPTTAAAPPAADGSCEADVDIDIDIDVDVDASASGSDGAPPATTAAPTTPAPTTAAPTTAAPTTPAATTPAPTTPAPTTPAATTPAPTTPAPTTPAPTTPAATTPAATTPAPTDKESSMSLMISMTDKLATAANLVKAGDASLKVVGEVLATAGKVAALVNPDVAVALEVLDEFEFLSCLLAKFVQFEASGMFETDDSAANGILEHNIITDLAEKFKSTFQLETELDFSLFR